MSKFYRLKNPTPWRRVSLATWKRPDDPTVYGTLSIDFTASKNFLEKINGSTEPVLSLSKDSPCPDKCKITVTHLVAKAMALTLKQYPDLNGIIRWGQIYLRRTVDLFFQVSVENEDSPEKPDLSGVVVEACEEKNLGAIASALKEKSRRVRSEGTSDFSRTFKILKYIPTFLQAWMIRAATFLIYNLGISAPRLGLPADPFGSAMITNVGMFKVPPGFAPLVPISRVPLIVCIGEVKDKPWVDNGQVVVRPILEVAITFDHRFMDGLTGSRMAHYFQEIIEQPERYFE